MNTIDRQIAFDRTGGRCFYCGLPLPPDRPEADEAIRRDWLLPYHMQRMTLDHIIPSIRGGVDEAENQAACCTLCNSKKAQSTIEEYRLRLGLQNGFLPHRFACEGEGTRRQYIVVVSPDFVRDMVLHNFPAATRAKTNVGIVRRLPSTSRKFPMASVLK